jgi:signal transduction histidine kinase
MVTPVWPSLLALAIVALLSIGLLGFDLAIERRTDVRTTKLLANTLRSLDLADDLRYQARRLAEPDLPADEVASVAARIGGDAREQASLIRPSAQATWIELDAMLADLETSPDPETKRALIERIEANIDELSELHKEKAKADTLAVRRLNRRLIMADLGGGAITLVLIGVVAMALLGQLRRQRRLIQLYADSKEERERELEAFAARVAHDLRGPLAPMAGSASLIRRGDPATPELGRRIAKSVERMSRIVDDMLALAVSGHPPAGRAQVPDVVRDVVDDLRPALDEARAELALDVDACAVACAPSVLGQLLHNLVSNSIKYRSPGRTLELRISAHASGSEVLVEVEDNGLGMSSPSVGRAFEPFFRAANATADGHGLGLTIVKRTVDALGGGCDLRSEEDHGTAIRMRLPAAACAVSANGGAPPMFRPTMTCRTRSRPTT